MINDNDVIMKINGDNGNDINDNEILILMM